MGKAREGGRERIKIRGQYRAVNTFAYTGTIPTAVCAKGRERERQQRFKLSRYMTFTYCMFSSPSTLLFSHSFSQFFGTKKYGKFSIQLLDIVHTPIHAATHHHNNTVVFVFSSISSYIIFLSYILFETVVVHHYYRHTYIRSHTRRIWMKGPWGLSFNITGLPSGLRHG